MKNPLSRASSQELIGIDFSSDYLKLAHLKSSRIKKEIVNILSHNISGLTDDDISKIAADSFERLKVKNPVVLNIIPSHMVITKNIEIPSTDPQEIREIINLQASRYTPYSREEIIVDYIEIDTYKHSYTKILLVIVTRDVVRRQYNILERAGIRLENVVLAPESIAWFIPNALKLETEASPVSIAHIDRDFSDFIVVFRNKPVFIRSIPVGAQYLVGGSQSYQLKFVEELTSSFEGYQGEDIGNAPTKLILTGAVEELENLGSSLTDALHLPTNVEPYFKNLINLKKSVKIPPVAKELSFLNVVASLLSWKELKVNLIPEEIKVKKSLEDKGRDLIKTGIFVLTIFVLIFSILIGKVYFKNTYLKGLNTEYQSLSQGAQELEADFEKVNLIKSYLSNRGHSLEVLSELYNVAPWDLELNDIRFDNDSGKFSIKGTAEAMSTVFSFVDNMEKAKYFEDVKTKYTTKRKDGARDVTDFEINCLLNKRTEQ
ncbi:pilus assembly protein PilM [Candidatus Omnitrophota bacterium]